MLQKTNILIKALWIVTVLTEIQHTLFSLNQIELIDCIF